jgi:hypothetical protein
MRLPQRGLVFFSGDNITSKNSAVVPARVLMDDPGKSPPKKGRACDADIYGYKGTAGEMLSFTATPAFYDTDLTPID